MIPNDAEVAAFERDGVVVLRGAIDADTLELLAAGIEHNRRAPSAWAYQYTHPGQPLGFWTDYVTWPEVAEFETVARAGGLAEAARTLMRSATSRFFHEHVLVKEPGTTERTPWHHDQPYYCVDGDQNVSMWIALDPVPAAVGLRFLAGSHRWGRWFVPRRFLDHVPYADADDRFELVPDIDAQLAAAPDRYALCSFDVAPGDVIAFHFRALHDAPGTHALPTPRRAISFRWLGDDATFALRPWLHSPPFDQRDLVLGGPLDDERFPLIG